MGHSVRGPLGGVLLQHAVRQAALDAAHVGQAVRHSRAFTGEAKQCPHDVTTTRVACGPVPLVAAGNALPDPQRSCCVQGVASGAGRVRRGMERADCRHRAPTVTAARFQFLWCDHPFIRLCCIFCRAAGSTGLGLPRTDGLAHFIIARHASRLRTRPPSSNGSQGSNASNPRRRPRLPGGVLAPERVRSWRVEHFGGVLRPTLLYGYARSGNSRHPSGIHGVMGLSRWGYLGGKLTSQPGPFL